MTVITLGQKMGSMHLFRIFTEKLRVLWLIQKKKKKMLVEQNYINFEVKKEQAFWCYFVARYSYSLQLQNFDQLFEVQDLVLYHDEV